ncbi:integrase, catalytic region, zinc finger, CCHC-type containing protein [Tanacetum coccineum]|uniref:Integrase, catalytic region, zinc finger, CCHC-type containing protein n=1 Tax=Tanacetum coccineum TaxID=301880 RepID=A0ABQ5CRY5_9ASTR
MVSPWLRSPYTDFKLKKRKDGRVVVQDVLGRYNANNQGKPFQRNNARGNVVDGNVGGPSDLRFRLTSKDMMLLMQRPGEMVHFTDEEQSLFLVGEQVTNFDDDVDKFTENGIWPLNENLLIANENLIANCLSNQLMFAVEQSRCLDLEAEISKLQNENQKDVNNEMIRGFNKLEVEYLNLQLKYQHLQENFRNNKSQTSQDVPEFDSFFRIKLLETQLQEKDNAIRNLKAQVSKMNDRSCETYNAKDVTALIEQNECVRVELEKVKQHYKELYDSIKITRVHTREKTSTMLNEIESLKAQLKNKVSCVTSDSVKPKVLAPGMYAIDVKPIPHPLKNNRSAHLNYINHLKESVETIKEIVEEAKVVKPLDNTLNYACQYTKLSQELLEYVIGTCPKSFNERDNKAPSTPVTRKKQVTFSDKPGTSSSNTQKHEVHQKVQQTNIPVIPSTGVNDSTEASGSKPRSNTKKNRILPAKKENKKEVEVHLRTNKSGNQKADCLITVCARPSGFGKQRTGKKLALGKLDCGYQWRPTGKKFALGEMCHLTKLSVKCSTLYANQQDPNKIWGTEIPKSPNSTVFKCRYSTHSDCFRMQVVHVILWYLDSGCSKHMTGNRSKLKNFVEKYTGPVRFGNDHLGAIMGYGDYVMGDSVISRVYCVEGLGHNLFSVRQFCYSGLEVAFRKHTCFVRDFKGTDQLGKSKKFSHRPKSENTNMEVLHTLHMDLYGPMRVQSIKGKKYILVIVDDYSRFTWVKFLRSKDETRFSQRPSGLGENSNSYFVFTLF